MKNPAANMAFKVSAGNDKYVVVQASVLSDSFGNLKRLESQTGLPAHFH
jgi:hypothetical protein